MTMPDSMPNTAPQSAGSAIITLTMRIRAHYLNTRTQQNRYPVRFTGELEQPFEWVLLYRYEGQPAEAEDVWWRLPKDKRPQTLPEELGIAPVNILLLYE